ncbi:Fic family protein [bacterium]|nr:Fic family protein [bacterium]
MDYLKTHPWISFRLRLPADDHKLWLRLGEVASKCEHLAGVPLRPDIAKELHQIFLAKGVLATTAIEGNTLSEEQVRQQIAGTLKLPKSQQYLQQEVQNILDVCNEEVRRQLDVDPKARPSLTPQLIKEYNGAVLKDLEVEEGVIPGSYRNHSVVIGNVYRGAPAMDCEHLVDRMCSWLNSAEFDSPDDELRIPLALVKAVLAHVYLAWIHPFGDGNGRTARLIEFHLLFASGVPLPAAHLLSDHYNKTRTEYYRQLTLASRSGGDLLPFIRYALEGFLDGLRSQIDLIREQQMNVAWENYVHELFREIKTSPTQKRRRELVLEMSRHEWLDVSKLELLTPRIARDYAAAGDRMLQRDLNAISKMGLVERKYGKIRVAKYKIRAFLAGRVK